MTRKRGGAQPAKATPLTNSHASQRKVLAKRNADHGQRTGAGQPLTQVPVEWDTYEHDAGLHSERWRHSFAGDLYPCDECMDDEIWALAVRCRKLNEPSWRQGTPGYVE